MLSIVIPAYNEEERIVKTLKRIVEYADRHIRDYEIIVVDDGSEDNTALVVKKQKIKLISYKKNRGKGYAVKQGVLKSKGDYILITDSDLATPIEEYNKLKQFIKEYEIVVGSRTLRVKQTWLRIFLGVVFSFIVRLLFHLGIRDTQCGFKLFRKEPAKRIFSMLKTNGFAFDVEALLLAKRIGYKIKEVPVKWTNKKGSKVRLGHSLKMFMELLRLKFS